MKKQTKNYESKNRLKQIQEKNQYLQSMRQRFERKEATKEDLEVVLDSIESYFKDSKMPSLALYTGDYSGEIMDLAFENYPDIFSRARYERKAKQSYKRLLAESYDVVLEKIGYGEIRQSQLLEFLKYIEPYLADRKEEENVGGSTIEMILTTSSCKNKS